MTYLSRRHFYQIQSFERPVSSLRPSPSSMRLGLSMEVLILASFSESASLIILDISMGNLCFTCYSALETDEYLWRDLGGQPHTVPYESEEPRPAHLPKNLVRVASWASWYDSPWEDICLVDWSESFPIDESRSSIPQPWNMRSPEGFFLKSYDRHLDLWRAGGLVRRFLCHFELFQANKGGVDIGPFLSDEPI